MVGKSNGIALPIEEREDDRISFDSKSNPKWNMLIISYINISKSARCARKFRPVIFLNYVDLIDCVVNFSKQI